MFVHVFAVPIFRFAAALAMVLAVGITSVADQPGLSITYLQRFNIEDASEGLKEPSGLTLSRGRRALWTISDQSDAIYKLGIDGELKRNDYFEIDSKRLEGIALDADGRHLFAVQENENAIIKIDLNDEREVASSLLREMRGFNMVAVDFPVRQRNKGLECITLKPDGDLLVIKEANPGLLIEVSAELDEIRSVVRLTGARGFVDDDTDPDSIDYSGVCYDTKRNQLWIVSDQAKRLYLFDLATGQVAQSFALGYGRRGEYREIAKAEGVAIDPDTDRLYIVSDKEQRLYVYQVR